MNAHRVVITGAGVVSAAGLGAQPLMDALSQPHGCTRRIEGFDACGFPCQVGGELPDFSARDFVPKNYRKAVKVMARDIEIAVAAADLAVRDAGIVTNGIDRSSREHRLRPLRLQHRRGADLRGPERTGHGRQHGRGRRQVRHQAWGQRGHEQPHARCGC